MLAPKTDSSDISIELQATDPRNGTLDIFQSRAHKICVLRTSSRVISNLLLLNKNTLKQPVSD